ncbi:MAG TPA: hypothetical protein VK666_07935 [Chryseolinea sp.]|nr:hypothetical protein [Chryseolinea sp.]
MLKEINRGINIIVCIMIAGFSLILLDSFHSPDKNKNTQVTIRGDRFYFNNEIINKGAPAEGLLMNVRMVNAVFEDKSANPASKMNFDPISNTNRFLGKLPEYVSSGVNAFTISLQGGSPGYERAVNSAFNSDGSLREEYLQRVEKVISACARNHSAVILSCFYQRQHSNYSALNGKDCIFKAVENTAKWLVAKKFTNVLLEVTNEYGHNGFRNWPDGDWLITEAAQVELMRLAKRTAPSLLVSTSSMGDGTFNNVLAQEGDFLLIHFNNSSIDQYQSAIDRLKKYGKPIICNEDDKVGREGAAALATSIFYGCGGGYMNLKHNQTYPFAFDGVSDDTAVYRMFRNLTTAGFRIDTPTLRNVPSIKITSPGDGQLFSVNKSIVVRLSHQPMDSVPFRIKILANNQVVKTAGQQLQSSISFDKPGVYILEAVVCDLHGKEIYRSSKTDIIVKDESHE